MININPEERTIFENANKDILVCKYTFRTDPELYERDFLNRSIRYYISKWTADNNGKAVPAEITRYQGLWFHGLARSKKFIYSNLDNMDWADISKNVKLRENFIREFKDYVDWKCICMYQKLKKPFILEMKKYTNKWKKYL